MAKKKATPQEQLTGIIGLIVIIVIVVLAAKSCKSCKTKELSEMTPTEITEREMAYIKTFAQRWIADAEHLDVKLTDTTYHTMQDPSKFDERVQPHPAHVVRITGKIKNPSTSELYDYNILIGYATLEDIRAQKATVYEYYSQRLGQVYTNYPSTETPKQ